MSRATSPYLQPLADLMNAVSQLAKVLDESDVFLKDRNLTTRAKDIYLNISQSDIASEHERHAKQAEIKWSFSETLHLLLANIDVAVKSNCIPERVTKRIDKFVAAVKVALLNIVTFGLVNTTKSGRDYCDAMFFTLPKEKEVAKQAITAKTDKVKKVLTQLQAVQTTPQLK